MSAVAIKDIARIFFVNPFRYYEVLTPKIHTYIDLK